MNEPLLTDSSLEGVILLVVQSKLAADWLRDRLHGAQLMNRTQFSLEVSGGGCFQICCFIMYCIVKCSSLLSWLVKANLLKSYLNLLVELAKGKASLLFSCILINGACHIWQGNISVIRFFQIPLFFSALLLPQFLSQSHE